MIATAFDEENCVLDAPPGMTPDECTPLSVFRGAADGGIPVVISCWKPTVAEMEEIRKTGRIWITICGHTMPPIDPSGFSPFKPRPEGE